MRRILAVLILLLPATASAAEPVTISAPREEITGLWVDEAGVTWTWRDGQEVGSARAAADGSETALAPGYAGSAWYGPGLIEVFHHEGRITVERSGREIEIARDRPEVSDLRVTRNRKGRQMVAWVERGRRISVAVAPTAEADFGRPRVLARGGVQAMGFADNFHGREGMLVWQDATGRLRARIREAEPKPGGFLPPFTVKRRVRPIGTLGFDYGAVGATAALVWSTDRGVFGAAKTGAQARFPAPRRYDASPATGIAFDGGKAAWGVPGAVHYANFSFGDIEERRLEVDGTPFLNALSYRDVAYTLDGTVFYESEAIGRGREARLLGNQVFFIDGGVVRKARADAEPTPTED